MPSLPASSTKHYHPYFTPAEVESLSEKQRGKLSASQEQKVRQYACGEMEVIGGRLGFPRRTIATAQNLYHRFHLYFPRKDFNYHDVVLAALYVATKMHDTLKKPQDLLLASYVTRFPERGVKSKNYSEIENYVDAATHQHDRTKVLAIERLILETICFNFTFKLPFPYVIKIAKLFRASKEFTKFTWRLAIDCHRTLIPTQYPPHTVALGSIYTAALLLSFEQPLPAPSNVHASPHEIATILSKRGPWETKFRIQVEDIEDIAHAILDLMIHSAQNPSASTSPSTPQSPSPHPSPRNQQLSSHQQQQQQYQQRFLPLYKPDQLTRLKIAMRETEHPARKRSQPIVPGKEDAGMIGQKEGTVRFLFSPPWTMGSEDRAAK